LERLRRDGVLVRERHSERDPDEITGYSVASPDSVDAEGKPVYYGGGRLAADLTLPKLRTGPRPPAALRGKTYSRRETERAVGKAPYSVELDAQRISAWLPEDLGKAHSTANWAHRLWRRRLRNPRTSGWVASTVPVNAIAPIATSTETLPSLAQYTSRQVEQQGKLVNNERQAGAVGQSDRRMPTGAVLAVHGHTADPGEHRDAPQVMVQVLAAR
jgi:hypothetical protein